MIDLDDPPAPMRVAIKESHKSNHRFKLGACFGSGNYQTLHAESYAIYKAVRQGISLKGTTLYVYRKNNNLAKPCPCCMGLVHEYGIKEVIYSGLR